jgi:alkanesulfonate monooxygenase SsuD/methylene tetrahydromethanopterin reductase-like flavin-dependent oxidoreductase (luciferase family)
MDQQLSQAPLTHGSIFTVMNLHYGLGASAALEVLRLQARAAVDAGLDGVGLSEHHAGFPGYLPVPLQAAGLLLAELPRGFAAAMPVILPLWRTAGLVEEAAWLDARFPSRVVLGLAAGYQADDFTAFEVPFAGRFARFRSGFSSVAAALRGESAVEHLRRDPAVMASVGRISLVMNTSGLRNAEVAARAGAGISPTQLTEEEYRALFAAYRAAGGRGPRVVQRWVFLGDVPAAAVEALNRGYRSAPGDHRWMGTAPLIGPLADRRPERLAERLVAWMRASDATALCVRFHLGPLEPAAVDEQIARFGSEVLPLIRSELPLPPRQFQ